MNIVCCSRDWGFKSNKEEGKTLAENLIFFNRSYLAGLLLLLLMSCGLHPNKQYFSHNETLNLEDFYCYLTGDTVNNTWVLLQLRATLPR